MPSAYDHGPDPQKKVKTIKSAYDSESFDADGSIHVSGLVGSATISPSGRDIALASPEGLAIIDLDSPYSTPRKLSSHGLPWLVVDVQWSPFAARDYWVASTANHRCLVWNLNLRDDSSNGAVEHSLQGHSRAITDINFSAHHPDILATCSVDGYVHTWDLRRPRQPVLTFCDWFAGATQVRNNRQNAHLLASSHDRWLHVWDDRKPAEPLRTISAHTSKIYGLDWNRTRVDNLVTCSLDRSIKFWDYTREDDVPTGTIRTDFPVWRARYTPFGHGLLAMPQTEPGNLYLYDRRPVNEGEADAVVAPTAVFAGHGTHKVKEFLWRSRGGVDENNLDNREFQLVSWGEDNELRLQKVDPHLLESVGYVRGKPVRQNLAFTRKGAAYKTFRTVDDTVQRDRKSATMSDPRPGTSGSGQYRRSALTMGMNTPHRRLGPSWKAPSMKANAAAARSSLDRTQVQIGWMKGISMTKRKSGLQPPSRNNSKDAPLFAHRYHDDNWSEPETIQEEFVRISNQFPNVKWDNIDMDSLTLNASLKGPWGVQSETIFIKVKVDIPTSYPRAKAPKFLVDKTSFMPDATHKKLEHDLHRLASQFLQRKENCLDVAFSYLLGEVDLEASSTFFKNVRDLEDDDALADESSSEDDDNDIPAGGSASMSQELSASVELDPTSTLAPVQRPIAPPPPMFTGARFSNDGRLVCFFPTKEEKAKAFFYLSAAELGPPKSKDEPTFAGFGRLTHLSPGPKHRYAHDEASATDDHSDDSDDSDDSSSSSSDSEFTTMTKFNSWYHPARRFRKALSANDSVRSSGAGTGNGTGTGTGTGTSRRRPGKPKNIIALYDMRAELPSKQQLAHEYAIFGDGAEVCSHNAQVAAKYGHPDLVDVWTYAAILLRKDIPLELHWPQTNKKDSVLVIARDVVARVREKEELDGGTSSRDMVKFSGRVKWGHHPLAQEFITDLFDHFEKMADLQMLAMLSCIFGDASAENGVAYTESHLTQPETPLPMKAPAFSLDYFPTDPAQWGLKTKSYTNSAATTPGTVHTPVLYSDSQGSEDVAWLGEPSSNSYSCGDTPPHVTHIRHHIREGQWRTQPHSLSTSPDTRGFRRANSAAAVAFAASLPRTLAGMVSGSGSPPEPPQRKRLSPSETILSNIATGNITWGAATVFGMTPADPSGTATTRTSISDDDYSRDEFVAMVPVGVSVQTENQNLFDDDGWLSTPLLDYTHQRMYSRYRYAYSEMLQMWGQPLARLEILKFNVLKQDGHLDGDGMYSDVHAGSPNASHTPHDLTAATTPGAISPSLPLGTRKELLQALLVSGRGLDVTGICRVHETQLDPVEYSRATNGNIGGAVGCCHRCAPHAKIPQTQLRCVYCTEPVAAFYPACLSCGCAFHDTCLAEWHLLGETDCPAGDDCNCVEEASQGQVESWPALQAAISRNQARRAIAEKAITLGTGAGRQRRRSVPAKLNVVGAEESESKSGPAHSPGLVVGSRRKTSVHYGSAGGSAGGSSQLSEAGDRDSDEWERVGSSHGIPSMSNMSGKPPPLGDEPISAAQLSLGNRLKKSLTQSGRPRPPRQKSGAIPTWKSRTGL